MKRMLAFMLLIGSLFTATAVISQEATSVETNAVDIWRAKTTKVATSTGLIRHLENYGVPKLEKRAMNGNIWGR